MSVKRTKKKGSVSVEQQPAFGNHFEDSVSKQVLVQKLGTPDEMRFRFNSDLNPRAEDWLEHMKKYYPESLYEDLLAKGGITPRLPTTAEERKSIPLADALDYFPDALIEVSRIIAAGQLQHNVDKWDRSKSTDHESCLLRHFVDRGTVDSDGMRHTAKMVWRGLALLQLEMEKEKGLPPSRGSK